MDTSEPVDPTDTTEEEIQELQELINSTVEDAGDGTSRVREDEDVTQRQFQKGFCFIQTADGRISDVLYTEAENIHIANIKKAITGAFQANFDGQDSREEADASGLYNAHYRYVCN